MTDQPRRIWVWPNHDVYGVQSWHKGCFRAEPRRPLDKADGPTGSEYIAAKVIDVDLIESALMDANDLDVTFRDLAKAVVAAIRKEAAQ